MAYGKQKKTTWLRKKKRETRSREWKKKMFREEFDDRQKFRRRIEWSLSIDSLYSPRSLPFFPDLISRKISLDSGETGTGGRRETSLNRNGSPTDRRRGWPGTFVRGCSSHPILRNFPSVSRASSLEMKSRMRVQQGQSERLSGEVLRRALVGRGESRRRLELARRYRDKGVEWAERH